MCSSGLKRIGVVVLVMALGSRPCDARAQQIPVSMFAAPSQEGVPASSATSLPDQSAGLLSPTAGRFMERSLLAAGGAFVGLVGGAYGAWALSGGSDDCDLCWQAGLVSAVGGILGGALATTLADGEMPRALVGSVVGAAAGSLVLAVLDQSVDLDSGAMTVSFAIPYSLITGYLSAP